ncbi:nucleotidyltransferase family protein [Heyndrickxia sporothermodurans]
MKEMKIISVYLAAGQSKRMGSHKLSLPLGTVCLGSVALKTILQTDIDFTIVVTNPLDELTWISPSLEEDKRWCTISCPDAWKGQAYSLRFGVEQAMLLQADAVIICLADQPFITINIINQLILTYRSNQNLEIVAAGFENIPRPPILFSKRIFSKLLLLEGDKGARELLKSNRQLATLAFHNPLSFFDIDNKRDYIRICQLIDKEDRREQNDHYRKKCDSEGCTGEGNR